MRRLTGRVARSRPWLPAEWPRGTAFKTMKFSHLLGHTSGINQMLIAKKAELPEATFNSLFNNKWHGLGNIVAQNPDPRLRP